MNGYAKEAFPLQYDALVGAFARPPEELYDLHTDPGEMRDPGVKLRDIRRRQQAAHRRG